MAKSIKAIKEQQGKAQDAPPQEAQEREPAKKWKRVFSRAGIPSLVEDNEQGGAQC